MSKNKILIFLAVIGLQASMLGMTKSSFDDIKAFYGRELAKAKSLQNSNYSELYSNAQSLLQQDFYDLGGELIAFNQAGARGDKADLIRSLINFKSQALDLRNEVSKDLINARTKDKNSLTALSAFLGELQKFADSKIRMLQ